MLSYRRAKTNDLAEIIKIYNTAVPSHEITDDEIPITVESRRDWFNHFNDDFPIWVVEKSNTIIGWCALGQFYPHRAYRFSAEISVYLTPDTRGHGYGQQILNFINQQINDHLNIKTVIAYVYENNLPSQKIFERSGYQQCGCLPQISFIDGKLKTLNIFAKHF
ncbi:MAG: GNAT family N-acetyltransferase [Limosilactobacillus sp.]|jgi:phosphinothricin acetyltransferase|uniref:GNAT family N-acetyltransferase n=1 Tax=Limosilactobacillus sp. TaxID=2773925 RepID=UPI0025C4BC17|nr:GNAT family N-acetyltransferase [Limosilactobacillus sp.]MCI1974309.1 GNAT family N-acetyltransferase [Limosilactobacillus sp.]MCI2030424.1 GNAT family N-acetyltransferase [Limosilactobacillus sp.]